MPDEETVYRLSNWDTPLWINPNRKSRRFNRAESAPTQYFSLHPLTPWAEWLRDNGVTSERQLIELRGRLWVAKIDLAEALVVDFDTCADYGLQPENLVGDDYEPCQDFAEHFREDPELPDAVVIPSAALPGTKNLVVFGARIAIPFLNTPLDAIDVPVSIASEDSAPPAFLLEHVRSFHSPHQEFQAWQRGEEFRAVLPAVVPLPD